MDNYIFIIWNAARKYEDEIIYDISKKFEIREVFEVTWTNEFFLENMSRFYGPKLVDVKKKVEMCKKEPFLIIIVNDKNSTYGKRRTSLGMENVNINLFDFKKQLRKKYDVGYAIHNSFTRKETNDDLTLLFGKSYNDFFISFPIKWDKKIKKCEKNLIGFNGWNNFSQMAYVLNSTINYVILRNFDSISDNLENYSHNDIDILTDDFLKMPYITNGGKSALNKFSDGFIKIHNNKIKLDIANTKDNVYDVKWYKDILKNKILQNGYYTPNLEDQFYTLIYHINYYQKPITAEYQNKLLQIAKKLEIKCSNDPDRNEWIEILFKFMRKKHYLKTTSINYKFKNNKLFRILRISIFLWREHGAKFLIEAIKTKIQNIELKMI